MRIDEVHAEPGGNVTITFVPQGYEVQGVYTGIRLEEWFERVFRVRYVLGALAVSAVFGLLAVYAGDRGASGTVQALIFAPGVVGVAYGVLSVIVGRITTLAKVFHAFRMADYKQYPAHAVQQAWVRQSYGSLAVTVRHTDGTQVSYTATGPAAPALGQGFHHLLGPRLTFY